MTRKKTSFKVKDVSGPPDAPWLWFSAALLQSDAWLTASPHLRRVLDFLHLEHLRHDRQQNGNLLAPYADLVKFGIGRNFILKAITEGEERGLIEVDHGLSFANGKRAPSRFRLTYFHTRSGNANHAPTDEWRHYHRVAEKPRPRNPIQKQKRELITELLKANPERSNRAIAKLAQVSHPIVGAIRREVENLTPWKERLGPVVDQGLGSEAKPSVSAKNQVVDHIPVTGRGSATTYTDSRRGRGAGDGLSTDRDGDGVRRCRAYVSNGSGHRLCGRPVAAGSERCREHIAVSVH